MAEVTYTYTYIDNSNFFIEGQRTAAVEKGMALDVLDAIERRVFDYSWQPDYGKLHALLCGDQKQIGGAKLWGSPPPGDSFWKMVEAKGFKVKTYERSYGKERKVDVTGTTNALGPGRGRNSKAPRVVCQTY